MITKVYGKHPSTIVSKSGIYQERVIVFQIRGVYFVFFEEGLRNYSILDFLFL